MDNRKIDFVFSDDWQALYIDDRKVIENHKLTLIEVLGHLDINFYVNEIVGEGMSFPQDLKDFEKEGLI